MNFQQSLKQSVGVSKGPRRRGDRLSLRYKGTQNAAKCLLGCIQFESMACEKT